MQDRRTTRRTLMGAGMALGVAGAIGLAPPAEAGGGNDPQWRPDTDPGKHVLEFEFPGLRIGTARYAEGPTGCTVFHFPAGATAIADIRGGAPATFFTNRLAEGSGYVDAICLAGGSVYGLEAAAGVSSALFERRNHATDWNKIAVVTGAIIYDFAVRPNSAYPDKRLGAAALEAARPGVFPMGDRGAGASASCGKWLYRTTESELSGQGGAFHQSGPTKVAVFSVVNSLGAIVDRDGTVVRGHLDPKTGKRVPMPDLRERDRGDGDRGGNTTLTVVVTNQRLSGGALRQLGREVHASMARVIDPFHTPTDGDVLFAVTTGKVRNPRLNAFQLAAIASECAADAVLSSFRGRD